MEYGRISFFSWHNYIYIYIYIYIYTHTHIHIHICTCTHTLMRRKFRGVAYSICSTRMFFFFLSYCLGKLRNTWKTNGVFVHKPFSWTYILTRKVISSVCLYFCYQQLVSIDFLQVGWPSLACECPGISVGGVGRQWLDAGSGALSFHKPLILIRGADRMKTTITES